jgi:hypothetical protein
MSIPKQSTVQATQSSAPLAEDPKIIQFMRIEEEIESWALSSDNKQTTERTALGWGRVILIWIGKMKTRVIVVPVINCVKNRVTGDIERIYGTVPLDIPAHLVSSCCHQ